MQFIVKIQLYTHWLHFWVGKNEFDAFCEKTGADDIKLDDTDGWCYDNAIWLSDAGNIEVAVHEITHAVFNLIEDHGLPLHTEVVAYLMGYVTQEYYTQINIDRSSYEI